MTIRELLLELYGWANQHAGTFALAALFVPFLGGVAVALAKSRRTDHAMYLANLLLYATMLFFVVVTLNVMMLYQIFDLSILDMNALLLGSPLIALGLTIGAIRLMFPLSQLASVQTVFDLAWFVGGCAALAWFFSKFHGWGMFFIGGFGSLILFLVVAVFFLRRVGKRAFGLAPRREARGVV